VPLPPARGNQCDVLSLPPEGQRVVLGTAGSGKTTLAILRAAYLADKSTEHFGKTLLVTFNKTLVKYLQSYGARELRHVTVENFHKFANGYLADRGSNRPICSSDDRSAIIRRILRQHFAEQITASGLSVNSFVDLFVQEIQAMCALGVSTRDAYLAANIPRAGGAITRFLTKAEFFNAYEQYVARRNDPVARYDWDDLVAAALAEMSRDRTERLYRHIVIDEGQDFAPVMVQTLIKAMPRNGSLIFFADVAQQIYGRRVSWRDVGFHRDALPPILFRQNYRNTAEIARLGLAIAEMPYYQDIPDMVAPQGKMDAGPKPTLVGFSDYEEEIRFVCEQAVSASATGTVGVLCPRNRDVLVIAQRLPKESSTRLDTSMSRWIESGVYYGTIHAAKGLEFDTVILPFCGTPDLPPPYWVETHGQATADMDAGGLLYVAVTRAKRNLILSHTGQISHLLPADADLYTRYSP
jgi:superfamily I DNA/RNA helicase